MSAAAGASLSAEEASAAGASLFAEEAAAAGASLFAELAAAAGASLLAELAAAAGAALLPDDEPPHAHMDSTIAAARRVAIIFFIILSFLCFLC